MHRRLLTLRADTPFPVNNINAIAKKGNAKPTKGETTGMGTCKDVSERGGGLLRTTLSFSDCALRISGSHRVSARRFSADATSSGFLSLRSSSRLVSQFFRYANIMNAKKSDAYSGGNRTRPDFATYQGGFALQEGAGYETRKTDGTWKKQTRSVSSGDRKPAGKWLHPKVCRPPLPHDRGQS